MDRLTRGSVGLATHDIGLSKASASHRSLEGEPSRSLQN